MMAVTTNELDDLNKGIKELGEEIDEELKNVPPTTEETKSS